MKKLYILDRKHSSDHLLLTAAASTEEGLEQFLNTHKEVGKIYLADCIQIEEIDGYKIHLVKENQKCQQSEKLFFIHLTAKTANSLFYQEVKTFVIDVSEAKAIENLKRRLNTGLQEELEFCDSIIIKKIEQVSDYFVSLEKQTSNTLAYFQDDIQKMQSYSDKFVQERGWNAFHTLKNLMIGLMVESSELIEIVQWMNDQEIEAIKENSSKMEHLKEEIGDVFHYFLRICSSLNIDPKEAFWEKIKKTEAKYPKELCQGKRDKYTEYENLKKEFKKSSTDR